MFYNTDSFHSAVGKEVSKVNEVCQGNEAGEILSLPSNVLLTLNPCRQHCGRKAKIEKIKFDKSKDK